MKFPRVAFVIIGATLLLGAGCMNGRISEIKVDADSDIQLGIEQKSNEPTTSNNNFVLELAYRTECITEYEEATISMENLAKTDLSLAIALGQRSGILNENNFVNDKDVWIRDCINEKHTK